MSFPVFYVPSGDVLPVMFSSYAGATGASITMTGLAVTDIEIYKDGGVTQRASDAGYTLLDTDGIDFDGITGIHGFSIDTGDNTDAGFYTVGAWFTVVVSAITIDSQTVNFIAAQFRLMPAEAIAGKPKVDVDAWLGTAAATPTVAGVPEVDLTHVAGATTNVSALATNVDAILTDTAVIGATGAGLTSLATQASVNTIDDFLDTEIAAIKAKTDQLTFTTANQVDSTTVTNSDKTGYALSATGSAALTEGYAADGATGTLPQLLYMILSLLSEKSISGTTLTAKKLDGTTTAGTFTLDDATTPTSITRAT